MRQGNEERGCDREFDVRIRPARRTTASYPGGMTREQEIRALNEQYIRSILVGDVAWFAHHLADDFVCIESDATLVDKAAFLRRTAGEPTTATYHLDEVDVSFHGDVALVRAKGSWVAKNGKSGFSRYVDVNARTGNEWRVVSAQITRPPGLG
jgi:ketosteroid isomerase-like protein